MSDDEEYFIPLQDQRVFGAGLKRKRVQFVPAKPRPATPPLPSSTPSLSVAERYLSIVLPPSTSSSDANASMNAGADADAQSTAPSSSTVICPICSLPVHSASQQSQSLTEHKTSTAHQACLPHSHPPSHVDRRRKGLKYLASYGWDPDSRRGLGAEEQGMRDVIKVKEKNDTVGLGVKVKPGMVVKKKEKKLGAKEARLKARENDIKAKELRDNLYLDEEVLKYLGELK